MTANIRQVWETYVQSWKVQGTEERRILFDEAFEADGVYQDPLARTEGFEELHGYMTEFHRLFPGAYFRTVEFLAHHGQSVARWEMLGPDGAVLSTGIGHGLYGDSGKLCRVTGFFEVPQEE